MLAARLRDPAGGSLSERHLLLVSVTDLFTSRLARGECLLYFPESAVASCNGRRSVCEGREQHRRPNVLIIRLYLGSVGLGVSLPVGGAAEYLGRIALGYLGRLAGLAIQGPPPPPKPGRTGLGEGSMPGGAGEADKEVGLFSWGSNMLRHAHGT